MPLSLSLSLSRSSSIACLKLSEIYCHRLVTGEEVEATIALADKMSFGSAISDIAASHAMSVQ